MTRRCPRLHVELAANIVRDFEALPESPEGTVIQFAKPDEHLTPGTLALCRNNAPLLRTAFHLAANNVPVSITGKDVGEGLAKFVEGFEATDLADLSRKVNQYRDSEMDRLWDEDGSDDVIAAVHDRCDCVQAVSAGKSTPTQVAMAIREVFLEADSTNSDRIVTLSSVHRAKGREADKVVILEPGLMPSKAARTQEAYKQELNLLYVACTRSKRDLAVCGSLPLPLMGE